jgi:hypothetical protein
MKVLVIGGSGAVGRQIVAEGHQAVDDRCARFLERENTRRVGLDPTVATVARHVRRRDRRRGGSSTDGCTMTGTPSRFDERRRFGSGS